MGALPTQHGRPRLREDVLFAATPDGVYLCSDYGSCLLRGRNAHDLVSRLAPVLDGKRTLAELTARLPEDQRSTVERLVRELVRHRMVVNDLPPSPHRLTDDELSVYAQEIAFIGYALDSPEHRFQRVRHCRTLLTGDDVLVCMLVEALIGSGWRDLLVATDEPAVAELAADTLSRCRRDPNSGCGWRRPEAAPSGQTGQIWRLQWPAIQPPWSTCAARSRIQHRNGAGAGAAAGGVAGPGGPARGPAGSRPARLGQPGRVVAPRGRTPGPGGAARRRSRGRGESRCCGQAWQSERTAP